MFLSTLPHIDKKFINLYKLGKESRDRDQTELEMKDWINAYLEEIDKIN